MSTEEEIRALGKRWAAAEEQGDRQALDELTVDGFRLVGPVGFVLGKEQWLARYDGGVLVTESIDWSDVEILDLGDTVIAIGVHDQVASHKGNPANGRFRATHVVVRRDEQWRLASIHLSPIGGPPPFGKQGSAR
ncbi:nuclear transport factor 2 family protein [Amycolatopsis sp. NPDC059657]|uniref:nuclear transport factor 2 family protein n=1 Tax=Amycolatopsis sp. NPDC059657 TaxID=3346899 RepID=UPI00366F906C